MASRYQHRQSSQFLPVAFTCTISSISVQEVLADDRIHYYSFIKNPTFALCTPLARSVQFSLMNLENTLFFTRVLKCLQMTGSFSTTHYTASVAQGAQSIHTVKINAGQCCLSKPMNTAFQKLAAAFGRVSIVKNKQKTLSNIT